MDGPYLIEEQRVAYCDKYFFDKPRPMPEADPATFVTIERWFGRDARHVYFLHAIVPDADPASFVWLGGSNDQWAKDRHRAYHFSPSKAATRQRALDSANLDRFAILPCRAQEYAADIERVFRCGSLIRGADPATFGVMIQDRMGEAENSHSFHFARDASHVYFDGKPIREADPANFSVIHEPGLGHMEYGVDPRHGYLQAPATGKLLILAHAELPAPVRERYRTTVPLSRPSPSGCGG